MRLLLIAFVIASLQSDTTALVEASKEAKAKKKTKTSTTKVITNADVKKSKGKITQLPSTKTTTTEEPKPAQTLLEKQEAERTTRLAAEAKRAVAEKQVADLERELAALEQSYYEANDLDERDKVIAKKFADVKSKLDAAKKDLSGAAGSQPAEMKPEG